MTVFHGTGPKSLYSFTPFHLPYSPSSLSNFLSPCRFIHEAQREWYQCVKKPPHFDIIGYRMVEANKYIYSIRDMKIPSLIGHITMHLTKSINKLANITANISVSFKNILHFLLCIKLRLKFQTWNWSSSSVKYGCVAVMGRNWKWTK